MINKVVELIHKGRTFEIYIQNDLLTLEKSNLISHTNDYIEMLDYYENLTVIIPTDKIIKVKEVKLDKSLPEIIAKRNRR